MEDKFGGVEEPWDISKNFLKFYSFLTKRPIQLAECFFKKLSV